MSWELTGLPAGGKGHRRSRDGIRSREGGRTGAALSPLVPEERPSLPSAGSELALHTGLFLPRVTVDAELLLQDRGGRGSTEEMAHGVMETGFL